MLNEPSGLRVWMADVMDPVTQREVTNQRILTCLQQLIGPHVEFLSVKAVFKDHHTEKITTQTLPRLGTKKTGSTGKGQPKYLPGLHLMMQR